MSSSVGRQGQITFPYHLLEERWGRLDESESQKAWLMRQRGQKKNDWNSRKPSFFEIRQGLSADLNRTLIARGNRFEHNTKSFLSRWIIFNLNLFPVLGRSFRNGIITSSDILQKGPFLEPFLVASATLSIWEQREPFFPNPFRLNKNLRQPANERPADHHSR
jgi:hypothetical protein